MEKRNNWEELWLEESTHLKAPRGLIGEMLVQQKRYDELWHKVELAFNTDKGFYLRGKREDVEKQDFSKVAWVSEEQMEANRKLDAKFRKIHYKALFGFVSEKTKRLRRQHEQFDSPILIVGHVGKSCSAHHMIEMARTKGLPVVLHEEMGEHGINQRLLQTNSGLVLAPPTEITLPYRITNVHEPFVEKGPQKKFRKQNNRKKNGRRKK